MSIVLRARTAVLFSALLAIFLVFASQGPASAQVTAYKQAIAEAASDDTAVAAFYQERAYKPIWTGKGNRDRQRRTALLAAYRGATNHGLPAARYNEAALKQAIRAAKTQSQRAALEVTLTKAFLQYARDVQTGMVTPSKVDSGLVRAVPYRDRKATLVAFSKSSPSGFMKALPPKSPEYVRLMKEKLRLEKLLAKGGWGDKVPAKSLKPGASGNAVVALRNRLIAMGFMGRSTTQTYDESIQAAVQQFQLAHGLSTDGVAGPGTMSEINKGVDVRLTQVMVAMERERWINKPLGDRHVWVNLTDFKAQIRNKGKVEFETRSVIGHVDSDRRSPEFSDVMEFMVINPSWYVPRSIATKEYLPLLKRNPGAVSHLEITDSRGRKVSRSAVNFAQYNERTFPFNMRQPPSRGNALGLVKFMFPNKYNIYLHDTPAKNLFSREVRAFSHGCIRLNDPFDFAYAVLSAQTSDPQGFFKARLNTGQETRVDLKKPLPVHIVYRTAFTSPAGNLHFRRDVYGRDAKIWKAMAAQGVALRAVRG